MSKKKIPKHVMMTPNNHEKIMTLQESLQTSYSAALNVMLNRLKITK